MLPDGMVRDQKHVEPAVRFFQQQEIDALFIPHCNFGTEGAAGMIAKQCGVPTLLWAPRDEAPLPDGSRLRDSLCGTLATSGVLHTLRVRFSYINNCRVEDDEFHRGVDRFVRAARVVKTTPVDEDRPDRTADRLLLVHDRQRGRTVAAVRHPGPADRPGRLMPNRPATDRSQPRRLPEGIGGVQRSGFAFNHYRNEDDILHNFSLRDVLLEAARENDLDGFCFQTFSSIPNEFHSFLNFGCCLIADAGYPVAPESDLHGAISSVLVEAASPGGEPSFLPEPTIRHPENDNAVLLWHGHAPLSLRAADSPVKIDMPWILKDLPTGGVSTSS